MCCLLQLVTTVMTTTSCPFPTPVHPHTSTNLRMLVRGKLGKHEQCMYRCVYHLFTSALSFHKSYHSKAPLRMYHLFVFSFNILQIYYHVLLPNLYFSISVLLSTTPAIFFQLHYPCISLSFLHPFPQLLVFLEICLLLDYPCINLSFLQCFSEFRVSLLFYPFLSLLFLKFLLFVPGKTKEKESYQPFFHCKCSVQSQRCYFHH